jgi:zinc protease
MVYRRSLFAVLGLLLALAPAAARAQTAGPADAGVFTTTLKNGLQVIVVEDHAAPVVQVATWYRFGSLQETPGKTGLAHALEHMMFRGTTNVSAGGLLDTTARLGAEMNGQTDYDYTEFYFTLPADRLDVGLYLEADRMQHAMLRQQDWDIERGAVLSELDGDDSSPFFNLLARVRAAAYPGDPHGRTPIGIRSDVAGATAKDIAKYYHEWYAPNNAALVVAGDVHHADVFAKVRSYFGAIPRKRLPARDDASPKAASGQSVEAEFPFPFEVVDLAYAIPGDTEPGEPAISTLSTFIENQRSPFYQALVQTNIALQLSTDADTQIKGGLLHVFIVLNPGHTADEAQTVFQATMDNLIHNGISPELAKGATRMTLADRIFSADSITGFGALAGYTYGIVGEKVKDEDDRLTALTPADLTAAAAKYLARPTVVGHLRPNDAPNRGSSNKSDATVSDDFSTREPNGPIVVPKAIATALRTPSNVHSKLSPVAFTLANGLHVIVQEKHDRPTFVLKGSIRSNPAFQPAGQEGISELASSVADYGSANYSFDLRRRTTDNLGAYVTTGARFSAVGMSRDFDAILKIVADGEMHPSFPQSWTDLERDQLANSISSENNLSSVFVDRAYQRLLLAPEDPSLRFATKESVSSISRDDLVAYAQSYWRPDLTAIAIVGDVDAARVRAALEAAFGTWNAQGPTPSTQRMPYPSATGGHAWVGTDSNQVFVRLGQPALASTSPDYDALTVLNQILGGAGAFESRLWQELRQKRGLVYSVSSSTNANVARGDFEIEMSASSGNVEHAIQLVREQLLLLQTKPVTATELLEARTRLVSQSLLSEESAEGQADELLDVASNGLPLDYYQTLAHRYDRITPADIQRVATTYLHPNDLIEIFAGPRGPWSEHGL